LSAHPQTHQHRALPTIKAVHNNIIFSSLLFSSLRCVSRVEFYSEGIPRPVPIPWQANVVLPRQRYLHYCWHSIPASRVYFWLFEPASSEAASCCSSATHLCNTGFLRICSSTWSARKHRTQRQISLMHAITSSACASVGDVRNRKWGCWTLGERKESRVHQAHACHP